MKARSSAACFAAVLLTLLSVALGGAVELPAQAAVAGIIGLLLIVFPPRALPVTPLLLTGALMIIAVAAFLPPVFTPAWRHYLLTEAEVPLTGMHTPQPWVTAQACALLFVGAAWALYLLAQPWRREDRVLAAELLVFGVAALSVVAVLAYVLRFHVPGWNQEENRGWFPNRNQTADVLALTGILNYALIFDRLRKGKPVGFFLLAALVPILIELVVSYSRAGILLFFAGILLWHIWPRPAHRNQGGSLKWVALSAALGLILVACFLAFGGDTLNRFQQAQGAGEEFFDFRGAIQLDALRFSLQSPFLGVGLGNFEPLFSFSRLASINANRAVHPESDWLWVACEMGWPALALLVGGYGWWLRQTLPLEKLPGESLRRAFVVAALIFAAHGFVDVSGHRLGSLFVALLMASLALPMRGNAEPSRAAALIFRLLGLLSLGIAVWWGGSLAAYPTPPTSATLARLSARATDPHASASNIVHDATAGLHIAPLDWELYLQRGAAEVSQTQGTDRAVADFATARALNPYWIASMIDEGRVLSSIGQPDLALDAWRDGLRRAGPLAPEAYRQMLQTAEPHSVERQGLVELALDHLDFLLLILPSATLDEANALIDHLLREDPSLQHLNPAERTELLAGWWKQGDQQGMMRVINAHPEWEADTWTYDAQFAARQNDFHLACEITGQHVPPPIIPQSVSGQDFGDLAAEFDSHPDNLSTGLLVVLAQMKSGQNEKALQTLGLLAKIPDHPRYLAYLAAQLYGSQNDWPRAWAAWQIYLAP